MSRRTLLWLVAALVVAAVILEAIAFLCGLHLGPFHPPTAGGYWGGV